MASEGDNSVHGPDKDCEQCRFWLAHRSIALHLAGHRMIDASKIVAEARKHRAHGVMSEAHFHYSGQPCTKDCVS